VIVFDLKCAGGHVFEAWFGSGADYDAQALAGQVRCPVCDNAEVGKAAMAPAVAAKGNRGAGMTEAKAKAMLGALAAAQAEAIKGSEWVGRSFATRARAMHVGEEDRATIHGQATLAEAKSLAEDGVPVSPLPLPIIPPEQLN
jgi:hypothetical protein